MLDNEKMQGLIIILDTLKEDFEKKRESRRTGLKTLYMPETSTQLSLFMHVLDDFKAKINLTNVSSKEIKQEDLEKTKYPTFWDQHRKENLKKIEHAIPWDDARRLKNPDRYFETLSILNVDSKHNAQRIANLKFLVDLIDKLATMAVENEGHDSFYNLCRNSIREIFNAMNEIEFNTYRTSCNPNETLADAARQAEYNANSYSTNQINTYSSSDIRKAELLKDEIELATNTKKQSQEMEDIARFTK